MDTNTGKSDTDFQSLAQLIHKEILGPHMEDMLSELKLATGSTKQRLAITYAVGNQVLHLSAMGISEGHRLMLYVCSNLADALKKEKQNQEKS